MLSESRESEEAFSIVCMRGCIPCVIAAADRQQRKWGGCMNTKYSKQSDWLTVILSIYLSDLRLPRKGKNVFPNVDQHLPLLATGLLFLTNSNYFPLMSSCSGGCALPSSLLQGQQLQCWAWLAAYTDLFPPTDCRQHSLTAGSQPPGAQRAHTRAHTVVAASCCIYLDICFNVVMTFLPSQINVTAPQ